MQISRRDISLLLPALAASSAAGASASMPSLALPFEKLPVKDNGKSASRQMFDGATHTGFHIDAHETQLQPGEAPHAPHHHVHEELIYVREGLMEVTISGKSQKLGPGSVAYVASNEEHGWRNIGTTKSAYFVLALGR